VTNTLTATVLPSRQVVLVVPSYTTVGVTHVQVTRIVNGQVDGIVRPHTQGDGGTFQKLSNAQAIMWDTEMPMDVPVSYTCVDEGNLAAAVTSAEVIVGSSGRLHLRNPVRPGLNVAITKVSPQLNSACLPVTGIYFQSMDATENYPSQGAVNPVEGSRYGAVSIKPRGGRTSTLNVVARTFVDRDAILALVDTGEPLQLSAPPEYGIPDTYLHVGDVSANRPLSDHRRQWRTVSLPFTAIGVPAGLTYGYLGSRWMDQCNLTWTAANSASVHGTDVLQGTRGYAGSTGGVRGNVQVLTDLAEQDGLDTTQQVYDPAIVVP